MGLTQPKRHSNPNDRMHHAKDAKGSKDTKCSNCDGSCKIDCGTEDGDGDWSSSFVVLLLGFEGICNMQLSHSCVGFLSKWADSLITLNHHALKVDFLLHIISDHNESLVMFGIQPATNMSATCANAFGLNTMSSGSAHSRFHKISMVAFVAGMAANDPWQPRGFLQLKNWAANHSNARSIPSTGCPTDIYRGFTIVELLSDLVQSQFPQSDGKVLHRSGQNGTGRKRSNAHAESCQKTSENHNECQLVSHSKSSEVDFTPFPDCGQTMTVVPNQVRFCEAKLSSMEIDIA